VRRFLAGHEVHTFTEMRWPDQLENELLKVAVESGFDVTVTSDQNIGLGGRGFRVLPSKRLRNDLYRYRLIEFVTVARSPRSNSDNTIAGI